MYHIIFLGLFIVKKQYLSTKSFLYFMISNIHTHSHLFDLSTIHCTSYAFFTSFPVDVTTLKEERSLPKLTIIIIRDNLGRSWNADAKVNPVAVIIISFRCQSICVPLRSDNVFVVHTILLVCFSCCCCCCSVFSFLLGFNVVAAFSMLPQLMLKDVVGMYMAPSCTSSMDSIIYCSSLFHYG